MKNFNYLLVVILLFLSSCEKNITLDLPKYDSKIVVDGYVELGLPPYILLSRSSGYFDPINQTSLNNLPVKDAIITISDGTSSVVMSEIDTSINGVSISGLYSTLDPVTNLPTMIGTTGRTYSIIIKVGETILTASSKLQEPVALDSIWFKIQEGKDTLGFVWATLSDPDTIDNCYRWFAKRNTKDDQYIAPFGSTFEDKFINGQTFDFAYNRGKIANSTAEDDNNEEDGFFKIGDTIIIKFCSIDRGTFNFWRDAETQLGNNGSPFAVPSNIKSNINGGLGVFATYSPTYDTIIAR